MEVRTHTYIHNYGSAYTYVIHTYGSAYTYVHMHKCIYILCNKMFLAESWVSEQELGLQSTASVMCRDDVMPPLCVVLMYCCL